MYAKWSVRKDVKLNSKQHARKNVRIYAGKYARIDAR
jgi:hypothetical protein